MTTRRAIQPPPVEPLVRLNSGDQILTRVQQHVEQATRDARALPQRKGKKISVTLPVPIAPATSKQVTVAHELGRKPEGFHQMSVSGAVPSYFEVSRDSRNLVLETSGTTECVVDLWVY